MQTCMELTLPANPWHSPFCLRPQSHPLFTGPPVNVALAIEVASIDHISEVNMVGAAGLCPPTPDPCVCPWDGAG